MKLSLINFQSGEEFILDAENPVIIGRGSLLGCHDKKISRNHGQIQLTSDGNVHLTALHSNPCFVMKSGLPPVIQLTKDKGKILCNDDYIGLLPDSFWYKIVVHNNKTDKVSNNILDVPDDWEVETPIEPANICDKPISQISKAETVNNLIQLNNETSNLENDNKLVSKPSKQVDSVISHSLVGDKLKLLENTKKLPLSMYEIDNFPEQVDKNKKEAQSLESSNETGVQFEENMVCLETDSTIGTISEDTSQPQRHVLMTDEEESLKSLVINNIDEKCDAEPQKENTSHSSKIIIDNFNGSTSNYNNISSNPTCLKRPICQYEEKCYRKNFQHKRDFCHPGDSDFVPYESRPVCQYGSSCYRKDRSHKIEYQHVKKRNLPKNPRKKPPGNSKEKKHTNTIEEDDYDVEDPFINDGSSDDYVPTDTNSDEDSQDFSSESDSDSSPKRRKLDTGRKNRLQFLGDSISYEIKKSVDPE